MKHLKDVIKESLYRTTKEQQTAEQKSVNTSIEKSKSIANTIQSNGVIQH